MIWSKKLNSRSLKSYEKIAAIEAPNFEEFLAEFLLSKNNEKVPSPEQLCWTWYFFLNLSLMVSMSAYPLLDRPSWFCDKYPLPNHQADRDTTHF